MRKTKELKKGQKGITLIALVITIIVLLILAGVSIATLTGNNGILTQANTAKERNNSATAKEKVQVEALGSIDKDGKFNKDIFKTNVKNNIKGSSIRKSGNSLIVTVDGYDVIVNEESGEVTVDKESAEQNPSTGGTTTSNPETTGDIEDRKIGLTWAELKQAANGIASNTNIDQTITAVTVTVGSKTETLRVGNYKTLKYDGVDKKVRIIGFNTDTKTNGSKAGITFDFATTLEKAPMNSKNTNVNGWGASKMKTETMSAMLAKIKLEDGTTGLETIVETVKKDYNMGNKSTINSTTPSEDKLWLLSNSEIFPKNSSDDRYANATTKEGEQYKYYEIVTNGVAYDSSNSKLVKYNSYAVDTNTSSNSSDWWWLRSPCSGNTNYFCGVGDSGYGSGNGTSSNPGSVAPGFCI